MAGLGRVVGMEPGSRLHQERDPQRVSGRLVLWCFEIPARLVHVEYTEDPVPRGLMKLAHFDPQQEFDTPTYISTPSYP